jgi:hypothetical protein
LTGRLVAPDVAERHPIAVMIDDLGPARPQSGFSAASVVWQAPAEGGIPRYMLIFQDRIPTDVGPVRSARYYFIAWASEWDAVYAHAGGSPQALSTLRAQGNGQLVYNADEFRWGGSFHRITTRNPPHNLYTSGKSLRRLAKNVGAKDGPLTAAWKFAPDAPLDQRPTGGTITVKYPYNTISYHYDRATNTYLRSVTGEAKQVDAATGQRVAPKNVVVMLMSFAPLNDNPLKHRLEADIIGSGKAWIATNGHTIVGTWKKTATDAPTRFYDAKGNQVVLTVGQTFVQVMPIGSPISIKDGTLASGAPAASPSPAP